MARYGVELTFCILFGACGGTAQVILKAPIQDQCESAGLRGCRSIAEGATLYADGKTTEGERQLATGLSENAEKAKELKQFADGLELVGKLPGAAPYVAPMQPVITLVQRAAQVAAAAESSRRSAAISRADQKPTSDSASVPNTNTSEEATVTSPSRPATTTDGKPSDTPEAPEHVSTFWLPNGSMLATECRFAGVPRMTCLHETIERTRTVTDISLSEACSSDVLVATRVQFNFDWLIYVPAGKGVQIHGANLPLIQSHTFTVAIVSAPLGKEAAPLDVRCGVTTVWHDAH
ncbi:MAG: hypothetical protein QM784_05475 [Polyangiaceae bacterium]